MKATSENPSRLILMTLCVFNGLIGFEFSFVGVALTRIGADFGVASDTSHLIVTTYAVSIGAFVLIGGRLAGYAGEKLILVSGLSLFGLTSIGLAGLHSFALAVVFRVAQGVGAALAIPAAMSHLSTAAADREKWLARWGSAASVGFALGAVAGGLVTQFTSWRWLFFVSGLASFVIALSLWRGLPRDQSRQRSIRVPLAGSIWLSTCVGAILIALSGNEIGLGHPGRLVLIFSVMAAGVLLGLHIRDSNSPVVSGRFLRRPSTVSANTVSMLATAAGGGMVVVVAAFALDVLGWPPYIVGLAFVPDAVAAAGGAWVAGVLTARGMPLALIVRLGFVTMGIGLTILALTPRTRIAAPFLLGGSSAVGFGLVVSAVAATIIATQGLAKSEHGLASGLVYTTQQIGLALGLGGSLLLGHLGSGLVDGNAVEWGFRIALTAGGLLAWVGALLSRQLNFNPIDVC